MSFTTLISVEDLAQALTTSDTLVVDSRFELGDPAWGERQYMAGHIPSAIYAHLDRDLSDLSQHGLGRHPLPDPAVFAATLGRWGLKPNTQVVVYDAGNASIAARLWWMLRLIGWQAVAVLDGGIAAWLALGRSLEKAIPARPATKMEADYDVSGIVYFDELEKKIKNNRTLLLDARGAQRYSGAVEPIDPIAGHIPGARNRPFTENVDAQGRWHATEQLYSEFQQLLVGRTANDVIHMCGSGVTACHNLLAMEYAGLSGSRVFAPSWSGWISDPTRSVIKGGEA